MLLVALYVDYLFLIESLPQMMEEFKQTLTEFEMIDTRLMYYFSITQALDKGDSKDSRGRITIQLTL